MNEQEGQRALDARVEVAAARALLRVEVEEARHVGVAHRAAVGAPCERREDRLRARPASSCSRSRAVQVKTFCRLGALSGPGRVERTLDRDLVELRDADRRDRIEALALERLQQLERRRRALLEERHADRVRARRDLQPLLEALLHLVAGQRRLQVVRLFVLRAAEPRQDDALAVEGDFEVVLELETADDVDRFPIEPRADHVLAVDREVVADRDAAARADRQTRHVIVLREIAAHAERLERRCDSRAGDGEAADLPRRREVSLHERRRDVQHRRVVVEAVGFLVWRQERGDIDVEREEIADGVAVLGAVQPVNGGVPQRRRRQRRLVDRGFQVGDEAVQRRLRRPRHA